MRIDLASNCRSRRLLFLSPYRVAKFESKVGSRRTTKIGNQVVLNIFLAALILIPYDMQCVLSS